MTFANRTEQRDHIFTSLGLLVAPFRRLVYSDDDLSKEFPFIDAEFRTSLRGFTGEIEAFCRSGGYFFQAQHNAIIENIHEFLYTSEELRTCKRDVCRDRFEKRLKACQYSIRQIPCEFDAVGIERGSPFQGYLAIRALCAGAGSQLEIFDPYLGPDVFHRYLSQSNPAVSVTLVTDEKRMKGKAGQEIVSVSQLFAAERPKTYRLLVDSSLHDRHIRCDGKIFHVGGTFKDVGSKDPCSITPADSPSIAATLDGHIAAATEWFGPNQTVHKT